MITWKNKLAKHLEYVGVTLLAFLGLNWLNELVFSQFQQSYGINWVFIPAGIRLLATLLFGLAGFEGLLLAGLYLNFHHFHFGDDFRAWSDAVAGAAGPYLAYLFAKHWFDLRPRLQGLTLPRLPFIGVLTTCRRAWTIILMQCGCDALRLSIRTAPSNRGWGPPIS
jgi:hypothetical protein